MSKYVIANYLYKLRVAIIYDYLLTLSILNAYSLN